MKTCRRIFLAAIGLLLAVASARAEDASDLFLRAYQEYQAGEKFERDGSPREAVTRYKNAVKVLEQITKSAPAWQPPVVEFRLRKARENIDRLAAQPAPLPSFQEGPEGPLPQADPGAISIPLPDVNTSRSLTPGRPAPAGQPPPAYQPRPSQAANAEADSLRQQIASIRRDNERWQEKSSRQAAELKSALFEVDRTKVTVVELKSQVAQAQDAFENAVKDREIARAKSPPPDDKRANALAERISKIEADNEALAEENGRLLTKLDSASKYIESADEGRKAIDADRKKILQQRDDALAKTKRLKENAATIARLDTEKSELEKKFVKEKHDLEARFAEASSPERLRKLESQNKLLAAQLATSENNRASDIAVRITKIEADNEALQDENSRLISKLESASKFIAAGDAGRKDLEADRQKLAAQRDAIAAKNLNLDARVEALADENSRLFTKLESASKYIAAADAGRRFLESDRKKVAAQRDAMAARNMRLDMRNEVLSDENSRLFAKLESASKYIEGAESVRRLLESDRRTLAGQRDEALASTKKLRADNAALEQIVEQKSAREEKLTREKHDLEDRIAALPNAGRLKKLSAENKRLAAGLEAAERRLAEAAKKPDDKVVAALRSDVNSLNDRLLEARTQIAIRDDQIKKLASQLDEASGEIARIKLNPEPTSEEKRALSENDLLRGIILRQIKEQGERDAARTALTQELSNLQVKSETVSRELEVLARPAFQLSEQEALLFKEPVALLTEPSPSSMEVTMAISKPGATPARTGPDALPKNARDLVAKAGKLFDEQKFADAEKLYQKIVESAPDNYFALTNLGVTQIQANKLSAAEVALKKAVSLNPKDSFAETNLGVVYCKLGRFEDAIASLKNAVARNERNHVALNYLGICYGEKGLKSESEDAFKRSIAVRDDYPDAHFNLAVLYAMLQPPALMPGKQHYKKALAFGASPDPVLDKIFQ